MWRIGAKGWSPLNELQVSRDCAQDAGYKISSQNLYIDCMLEEKHLEYIAFNRRIIRIDVPC